MGLPNVGKVGAAARLKGRPGFAVCLVQLRWGVDAPLTAARGAAPAGPAASHLFLAGGVSSWPQRIGPPTQRRLQKRRNRRKDSPHLQDTSTRYPAKKTETTETVDPLQCRRRERQGRRQSTLAKTHQYPLKPSTKQPNPGQSTLFNAIVENGKAAAANFPFCTIEPNVGMVTVPDARLEELSKISGSREIVGALLGG